MNDEVISQLVQAVNVILDPNSTSSQRSTAHHICESCKDSENSAMIGYNLASDKTIESHVKQFGLQLMQHSIRYRWVRSSQEMKMQLQNNAMMLLKECTQEECGFVKDGISHVITEIGKQVWPQQWPTMIQELITIARRAPVQTELVELIFLRLAEDVAVLQNVAVVQRSRDIRQGLALSMEEIIFFLYDVLEKSSSAYIQLLGTTNVNEQIEMKMYLSLSQCTLKTLQGFVEWINMERVFVEGGALVKLLSKLLNVDGLQISSVECLILIAYRKGQAEERLHTFQMTTPEYTNDMVTAIKKSVGTVSVDEEQYLFLKRMGCLFALLTNQIIAAWGEHINSFTSHVGLLDIILAFTENDNQVIASTVLQSWNVMLRNREINKDEMLLKYIPRLFQNAATRIRKDAKFFLPDYAKLDFNDDDEIETFMRSIRGTLVETIKVCTRCQPIHCITVGMQWLSAELSLPIETGVNSQGIKLEECAETSPSYIRWTALTSTLDMVLQNVLLSAKDHDEEAMLPIDVAENALNSLLGFNITDVFLCRCLLAFVVSFFPLLELMTRKKCLVIGILQLLVKFVDQRKEERYKLPVKLLRRYSLCGLVHLCKHYPKLVMGVNEEFKIMMMELIESKPEKLVHLEKVSVFESLVLVSGEWNSFSEQSSLIGKIMSISKDMWPSKEDSCMKSSKEFADAIGLCSPSSEYESAAHFTFRGNVSFCITLTLGMMNRGNAPRDIDLAKQGGFIDADGNVLNPCAEHILAVLEHIVILVQLFQGLWSPAVQQIVHKDMEKSLSLKECERRGLISTNPSALESDEGREKMPWQKMQNFIILNVENCYQILGGVGRHSATLYSSPQLFPFVLAKVFCDLQTLPELRVRTFIKQFLYHFLQYCPPSNYTSVAAPVLSKYCSFMNSMLNAKWDQYGMKEQARLKVVQSAVGDDVDENDGKEEDEIVKEQLLRTISREYLEMLVNLCVIKKPRSKSEDVADSENQIADNLGSSTGPTMGVSQMSPMGQVLMENEVAEILLATSLASISWHDTTTTFKGVQLIWPILKQTIAISPLIPDEVAKFLFEAVLQGLQRHGQHDGCKAQLLALGLFVFVNLRPSHPSLKLILNSIPNVNRAAVDDFDSKFLNLSEKKRKLAFKKLVGGIIDKHIGQRFNTRQEMELLPKIFSCKNRLKKMQDIDVKNYGFELLFQPES